MDNVVSLEKFKQSFKEERCQILCLNCGSRAFRLVCQNEDDEEYNVECFGCGVEMEGLMANGKSE